MTSLTNAAEATPVYYVHEEKLAMLRERFEKIGRRARKLGLTAPQLTERARFEQRVRGENKVVRVYPRVLCTVEGVSPVINGWKLLAAIEHIEGETMIYSFDESADLSAFRGASNVCEHCKTDRRRQSTFVLRHEDGSVKQIGRNCLVDFIGNADACHWFAASAEMLSRAVEACEDDEMCGMGGGGRSEGRYELESYLSWVWSAIRAFGWQARSNCPDGAIPTATRVLGTLNGSLPTRHVPAVPKPEEIDVKRAEESIEFVRSSTQDSEFFENLRVIARLGSVREKHAGLAAAFAPVFDRELRRRSESKKESVFVGTIDERMVLTLTLTHTFYVDGDYGVRCFARFNDESGNDFLWIASGEPAWLHNDKGEALKGEKFTVKATIKKHENDKRTGRPTTVLSRVAPFTPPAPKTPKPRRKKGDLSAKQEKAIEFARFMRESGARMADGTYNQSFTIGYTAYGAPKVETVQSLIERGLAFHSEEWGYGGFGPRSWGLTEWRSASCDATAPSCECPNESVTCNHQ